MTDRQVTDWRRSGPEPGKDHEGTWRDTAGRVTRITTSQPGRRRAFSPTTPTELSRALGVAGAGPSTGVIILTSAGGAFEEKRSPGFIAFPRRR